MIARQIYQADSGTAARQQQAQHLGVLVSPEEAFGETQRIDDIAAQNNGFSVHGAQEGKQFPGPRAFEPQVDIREEQGSHLQRALLSFYCS